MTGVQTRHLHQAIPTVVGKHRGRQQREEAEEEEVATAMVNHLERLSLVDFADLKGVARLGEAVKLAGAVVDVDTKGFRYKSRNQQKSKLSKALPKIFFAQELSLFIPPLN